MKINNLIKSVAKLVAEREIIDHGSIRMLHSEHAVAEIESAEGCDEVETGIIGDDDLAEKLNDLAEDGDAIAELHFKDLVALEEAFFGHEVTDYLDSEKEDELERLDALIDVARKIT